MPKPANPSSIYAYRSPKTGNAYGPSLAATPDPMSLKAKVPEKPAKPPVSDELKLS